MGRAHLISLSVCLSKQRASGKPIASIWARGFEGEQLFSERLAALYRSARQDGRVRPCLSACGHFLRGSSLETQTSGIQLSEPPTLSRVSIRKSDKTAFRQIACKLGCGRDDSLIATHKPSLRRRYNQIESCFSSFQQTCLAAAAAGANVK